MSDLITKQGSFQGVAPAKRVLVSSHTLSTHHGKHVGTTTHQTRTAQEQQQRKQGSSMHQTQQTHCCACGGHEDGVSQRVAPMAQLLLLCSGLTYNFNDKCGLGSLYSSRYWGLQRLVATSSGVGHPESTGGCAQGKGHTMQHAVLRLHQPHSHRHLQ